MILIIIMHVLLFPIVKFMKRKTKNKVDKRMIEGTKRSQIIAKDNGTGRKQAKRLKVKPFLIHNHFSVNFENTS